MLNNDQLDTGAMTLMTNDNLKLVGKAWHNYEQIGVAPETKKIYAHWIARFMSYCDIENPDDLLKIGTPE